MKITSQVKSPSFNLVGNLFDRKNGVYARINTICYEKYTTLTLEIGLFFNS